MRDRRAGVRGRRRSRHSGLLILILAITLALVTGASFKKAGGHSTDVTLWYLDETTRELVRTSNSVNLPVRRVEQAGAILDLLRIPPADQGLVTTVPSGLVARSAALLAGGILDVNLGISRQQAPMGYADEEALYRQIVNSFLSLPEVRSVELSVDKRPAGTFLSFVKTQREQVVHEELLDKGMDQELYFMTQDGSYAVEIRSLPGDVTRSQLAFYATRALMEGAAHTGLLSFLPTAEYLRGVTVSGQTATVDFEEKVSSFILEADQGQQAVSALVLTLTRLPGVARVRIEVGGKPVETLFGNVEATLPLFREDGRIEAGTELVTYSLKEVNGNTLPIMNISRQETALAGRNTMITSAVSLLSTPQTGGTTLVPAGTSVTAMSLDAGTGVLRLSLTIPTMPDSPQEEELLVEQMRLTMTEIPLVTSLQLSINGSVAFLPGGYYIGRPFPR